MKVGCDKHYTNRNQTEDSIALKTSFSLIYLESFSKVVPTKKSLTCKISKPRINHCIFASSLDLSPLLPVSCSHQHVVMLVTQERQSNFILIQCWQLRGMSLSQSPVTLDAEIRRTNYQVRKPLSSGGKLFIMLMRYPKAKAIIFWETQMTFWSDGSDKEGFT